jgi:hypothetical protein
MARRRLRPGEPIRLIQGEWRARIYPEGGIGYDEKGTGNWLVAAVFPPKKFERLAEAVAALAFPGHKGKRQLPRECWFSLEDFEREIGLR